jgi:hypothetical protein
LNLKEVFAIQHRSENNASGCFPLNFPLFSAGSDCPVKYSISTSFQADPALNFISCSRSTRKVAIPVSAAISLAGFLMTPALDCPSN